MDKVKMIDYGPFFTSDEHYGHRNVIKFCNRPFSDLDEMREELISRHNEKVPRGAATYHLGDMFWRTLSVDDALDILNRLNGQHALIFGNHDELIEDNDALQFRFLWCRQIERVQKKGSPKITLSHYAMRVWNGSHTGSWQLYGHSHGGLANNGELDERSLSMDVGVDTNDYYPYSHAEIVERMREKKLKYGEFWKAQKTLNEAKYKGRE